MGLDKSDKGNMEPEDLVGALYADLDGPEWSDAFLAGVCRATRSTSGAFVVTDLAQQRDALPAFYGAETVSALAYERRYAGHNPWRAARAAAHRHDGMILLSDDILPVAELQQTLFYRDFLQHLGVAHGAGLIGLSNTQAIGSLTLLRPPSAGVYTPEERRLLRALAPHWSNACALRQRFDALADQHRRLSTAVDHLALGVFLLNAEGLLVRTNAAADRLLSTWLGLKVRRGKLAALHPASDAALTRALTAAAAHPSFGAAPAHAVLLRAANGVRAAHAAVHRSGVGSSGDLAVFVRPVAGEHAAAGGGGGGGLAQALTDAYGLTAGEAALAQALADYRDLGAASAAMGIAPATARTRLKAVFGKLGVATQVELVSVLANLREVLGSQGTAPGAH